MWVRVWELYPTSFPAVRPWISQRIETMCRNLAAICNGLCLLGPMQGCRVGDGGHLNKHVFKCWCLHLIFLWVRNSPVYLRCVLFWHIKWRRVVIPYWWFGTTYWWHSQGSRSPRRISVNKLHSFFYYFISNTVGYFCPTAWFFSFLMNFIRNRMTAERQMNHTGKYTECPISLEP